MRIFVTGATGLIGRRLVLDRLERGDQLVVLSRDAPRADGLFAARANRNIEVIAGHPARPGAWQRVVDGCDAVVHLAGAGVADRRWTPAYRRELVESRIDSTHQVVEAIEAAKVRPAVLLCASAIGFYGDTGDDAVDEQQGKGHDFLADLAASWEAQALRAGPDATVDPGTPHGGGGETTGHEGTTRVVLLRTGLVLDLRGGMLARLIRPFRSFVGGPIGRGRQGMSWIHWADAVGLIDHALRRPEIRGPLNLVAPEPVSNREFSQALGRALRRPSWLPVPRLALQLRLGPFAHYVLMSQRVLPGRAVRTGYAFRFPNLDRALADLFGLEDATARAGARSASGAPGMVTGASSSNPAANVVPVSEITPPVRPRLIVISADGALLRRDRRLSPALVHAIRVAEGAGIVIVLASSRAPRVIMPLARTLELEGPLIAYNGAVIWSPPDRASRFHVALDPDLARQVIDIARAAAPDVRVAIEVLDHWFTDRFAMSGDSAAHLEPDEIGPLDRFLNEPVSQIDLLGTAEEIAGVRTRLGEALWRHGRIAAFDASSTMLQVVHPLADKGIAVQRIAERLGAARDAVVAIGGERHDAGLLEWAGFTCAVASAPEKLRTLCDVVIADPDDNGPARAIHACLARPAAPSNNIGVGSVG